MKKNLNPKVALIVRQRLITWSALAPVITLGLFLVQTQAQEQSPLVQGEDGLSLIHI